MNRGAGGSWYLRQQPDEASSSSSTHPPNIYPPDDLPKTVVRNFRIGNHVTSMDFHPQQQTVLAVGTNLGDISLWKVGSAERMVEKTFTVWKISACSDPFRTTWAEDATISVNRCVWDPKIGSILGIAFSKHIVQIYKYMDLAGNLKRGFEIDAHVGGVNDIAFAHPDSQFRSIVTCGDDMTVKVWDAATGKIQYTYEGHKAPVYSVCPHDKDDLQFLFSTSIDGKIKGWIYGLSGPRVKYDAPGRCCTRMAYSADATRIFCCGISKEGESHLVEWDEHERGIKRTYSGVRRRTSSVVQFDTTRNRFLAAGDDFQIKYWDMNNTNMLDYTDAGGGLPEFPSLRFNEQGSLLAVATSDCGIKILANAHGVRMLTSFWMDQW